MDFGDDLKGSPAEARQLKRRFCNLPKRERFGDFGFRSFGFGVLGFRF